MNNNCAHCPGGIGLKSPLMGTDKFYIVCDAHPLVEGHILLIPKEHISCMGDLDNDSFEEYKKQYKKICGFLENEYGKFAVFEHGVVGQTVFHAHVHFFPYTKTINDVVPETDALKEIESLEDIRKEFQKTGKYLFVQIEDKKYLVDVNLGFPRFFRDRFAKVLGAEIRGNWKKAQENSELMNTFKEEIDVLTNKWNSFF